MSTTDDLLNTGTLYGATGLTLGTGAQRPIRAGPSARGLPARWP
ncbi:hypothetical protein RAA17_05565 [Komagataeibacter rhaeticus]|nr:hypothetical protein [Komagataeibacter rhaeticus]